MPAEAPKELPEGWASALGSEERDYLYEESRRRLRETIEFGDQQEAKALALVRISLILIVASGIFGDLRVEIAPPTEWGWLGWLSIFALLSSLAVGAIAVWLLHPQSWRTGMDVRWFALWSWRGASERDMRGVMLQDLVDGFDRNLRITERRGQRLVWLLWSVSLQTLLLVLVQLAAAMDSPA